jgi:Glycosyl transferase family 2
MTSQHTLPDVSTERSILAPAARLTVVIETNNRREYTDLGLPPSDEVATAVDALAVQVDCGPVDILLVTKGDPTAEDRALATRPQVSIVSVAPGASYHEAHNIGGCAATTEYIGFVDSDCVPHPRWVHTAVAALEGGADVVTGRSRYADPGRWARFMTFFDFTTTGLRPDGSATQFVLSNSAFRRDVFVTHQLETRIRRSGGSYLASARLRADNCFMAYDPEMLVAHGNDYRRGLGLSKRLRNGHDAAVLLRVDDTGVMPHRWIVHLGPLADPLVAGKRIWDDWGRLLHQRADLGLSVFEVPVLALLSIPFRVIEGGAYAVSSVRPSIIGRYWA